MASGRGHKKKREYIMSTQQTRIFVNHVGFIPGGAKYFVITNPPAGDFQVIARQVPAQHSVALTGKLKRVSADMGTAWVGTFSEVQKEGTYLIRCGELRSRVVTVYEGVYEYPLRMIFNYFPTQRCGDSTTGWHAPCHTADGRQVDTGEHIEVTGGWHQSCDLRKWCQGTSPGMFGLAQFKLRKSPRWDRSQIAEEVRWGNQYFHGMVRPDGGLMDCVATPEGWVEERNICPNNAPSMAAYNTIIGQAMVAQVFKESDPDYSRKCLELAQSMWRYITGPDYPTTPYVPPTMYKDIGHNFMYGLFSQNYPGSALDLGDALYAALAMYRVTGDDQWLDTACVKASALVDLQVGGDVTSDAVAACFRVGPGRSDLVCAYNDGHFGPMGLCELLQLRPDHEHAKKWQQAVYLIAQQSCLMAERNPWGLVPLCWYSEDPGDGRKEGSGYYKYFYKYYDLNLKGTSYPHGFCVGLNMNILGRALFLLRAREITGDRRCFDVACRQLDWILGCNPLDASMVEGVGRNQPERLIYTFPPVPQIPGAVFTGMIGTEKDEPRRFWVEGDAVFTDDAEYNLPPTAMLMWLMSELSE